MVQLLRNAVWQFFGKVKHRITMFPSNSILGTYPKKLKADSQTDTCMPMFIATLFK